DREHARLPVEDRLHAVAVVHVDVHVRDALGAVRQHPGDGYGGIVVDAEAAGALGHRVVQPAGRVEGVLRPGSEHSLRGHHRGARHAGGRFVHVRKDGVVARAVAELLPRPWFPVAGSLGGIDVPVRVDQAQLVIGGVSSWSFDDPHAVDNPVRLDELAGEDHPGRSQRMLWSVIVPGRVVPVPDQLDPVAHGGRCSAARYAGYASAVIAYRNTGPAAATPVSFT